MSHKLERIAILYTRMSGYTSACLRALKEIYHTKILLYRWPESKNAPFDNKLIDFTDAHYIRNAEKTQKIINTIEYYKPQAVYISGWTDSGYFNAAKALKKKGVLIISGMDAQWSGNFNQRLACIAAKRFLHTAIDILWVPGERQRNFARRLGYTGNRCWSGMYTCDWEKFAIVKDNGTNTDSPFFLFVGRYVDVKGIDLLTRAYAQYRNKVENPWKLVCAGAGPRKNLLDSKSGITDCGFIQPDELPNLMAKDAVFILPSRKEPWGVVIQEAAAAGLPIMCSDACGASVHLVQDGYNGFLFESGNYLHLSKKMIQIHRLSKEKRHSMGERSHELSKQYTPRRWAETLVNGIKTWQDQYTNV